jgi:hypothetical protein
MRPEARSFYRTALLGFEHALDHSFVEGELDAAQVILSLDFGVEMLLKAVLLNHGTSIMERNKHSLDLLSTLKKCGPYKNGSAIEVLRERRNNLQHFAQYTDLPEHLEIHPVSVPLITSAELVHDVELLQRDVHASDSGIVVWAQNASSGNMLTVFVKEGDKDPRCLTPSGSFEYMPKTDGQRVVCFRQSGGVVMYDLNSGQRRVLSETGGAPFVQGEWIAAQGLSTEAGLAGGISLWNDATEKWEQISQAGDTARIAGDVLFWQELEGDQVNIKSRSLTGGPVKTVIDGANHPSPDGDLIAWTEWGNDDWMHVTKLDGTEVYRAPNGIFPSLRGTVVAYLRLKNNNYELMVDDIERGRNAFSLPWVGFPMGGGPVLAHDEVFFESRTNRPTNAIWKTTAKLVSGADR